ncbi:MAG: hypothetical protein LH468_01700 [Nocardioides sp.]|nr:hypothetical protein [Nocardioides sp.]
MDIHQWVDLRHLDGAFPLPSDEPFTHQSAVAVGLTRRQLLQLVQAGLVCRMVRGVYRPASLADTVRTRALALALVTPDDCVVVDRHAGWLLGAQMVLAPHEHLDLRPLSLYRPTGAGRLRNELTRSGERNLTDEDVTQVHGVAVTTPLRTAWDLGRVRWTDEAISGLDAMFRLQAFSRDEFLAGVERFRRMRWVTTLRAVGPLADGRSESPGESVLRLRCHECCLGGMVPQLEVWRDEIFLARLDLGDEDLMAAVEYDGAEWHASPAQREHDRARRVAVRDAGWLIESLTSANVFGHHRDVEQILFHLGDEARARKRRTA